MSLASDLLAAVQGAAPSVVGVSIGRRDDRSTWRVQLAEGASAGDVAVAQSAAQATIDAFIEEPGRRKVLKSVVVARLIAANKIDAAFAALNANKGAFARWFSPDHPAIYADDPEALTLLQAIGADPAVILAP